MRSNPRRLFLFYARGNAGHYQSTMTPNRDVLTPNRDVMGAKCIFLYKRETSTRTAPRTQAYISLRNDRHAWTDQNSLTGIDKQWVQK